MGAPGPTAVTRQTFASRLSVQLRSSRSPCPERRKSSARAEAVRVRGSIDHLVGLDGLRGLAVIAVLLYHAGALRGGFLGVEVFFVISGYLITLLLVEEWHRHGRIEISAFWARRIRRLWPASFVVIVATLCFSTVALPDELFATRGPALAGVLWLSNWYSIVVKQSYFEAVGRPPLLRHLWSLAIEAQFYAIWPLVLGPGLRFLRGRLALVAAVAAIASAVMMAGMYQQEADPSRVYYGTDTRASGLLLGAALALAFTRRHVHVRSAAADAIGCAALVALGFICAVLSEFDPLLYRGGFLIVDALSVVAIAAAVQPSGRIGGVILESKPLHWIGVRSYGIYLWHWPVFMLTRPQLDIPMDGLPLLLARLTAVGVLAELSYRCVEQPFRRGGIGRIRTFAGLAAGSALVVTSVAAANPVERPAYLPVDAIDTWAAATPAAVATEFVAESPAEPQSAPVVLEAATGEAQAAPVVEAATVQVAQTPRAELRVTAIGDSVMLGAASALEAQIQGIEVDAAISRQTSVAIDMLRARASAGDLGDVVIVHMGNNGTFTSAQFDAMMDVLGSVQRVVFVNVKVPRAWEGTNDAVLADGVLRYTNAVLVDWRGASVEHPDFFWDDGIHLRPTGAAAYAAMIAANIAP